MKRTLATAGLQASVAASRLLADCGQAAAYSWQDHSSIRPVNPTVTVMDVFGTAKHARRRKEPSP